MPELLLRLGEVLADLHNAVGRDLGEVADLLGTPAQLATRVWVERSVIESSSNVELVCRDIELTLFVFEHRDSSRCSSCVFAAAVSHHCVDTSWSTPRRFQGRHVPTVFSQGNIPSQALADRSRPLAFDYRDC